jgi:multiple sugar transport system substrate-binding protein/sn-glycerol 3-phosphate transport system substrate-binding protein
VLAASALAACQQGAPASPTPIATSAPAPTSAPAAATATSAPAVSSGSASMASGAIDAIDLTGKNVQVTYWHNRPQKDQDLLQSMLDAFNKSNPYGITARAEIAGAAYPDVYNKVNAAIQAGQPPELSVAYQNQAAFYRAQGAVIDLNPYLGSKKYGLSADDVKDYFQTFLDSDANPQFKGERLGFPTQRSIEVMYHNVDWLAKLGFDKVPQDWKTWEDATNKASDAANNKYGFAFKHDASNFASEVFSRGGRILSPDGTAYVFNSQAGVDAITLEQRLFKNKSAVEVQTSERNGEQSRLAAGNVLFAFGSSSGLPFYRDAVDKGAKFKWDIALLPFTDKPAVNLYGASVSVYKTTPEKQLAAWLMIKFLGEKPQTVKWAVNTGYLPVRQSAKDDVIAAYKADPKWGAAADSYAKMFDWFQYALIESPVAGYDPVRTLIDTDIMSKVITDSSVDPKSLLDAGVTKANGILKENAPKG